MQQAQKPGSKNSDQVKTLKRSFQPRNLKNYKNMMKFESNEAQIMERVPLPQNIGDTNANTPLISTAANSSLTGKISSFF